MIEPQTYDFLTLSPNGLITLHAVDMSDITVTSIEFTLTATLAEHTVVDAVTGTFFVSVLDPCTNTSLTFDPIVDNMIASINLNAANQLV